MGFGGGAVRDEAGVLTASGVLGATTWFDGSIGAVVAATGAVGNGEPKSTPWT